ncbi:hypothetical protein [Pyrobaculum sp.]|uniref:hypothetical protein n=1 Tax=Pyrobaculum sp. TaxID=2004705 RepID=UPI003D0CE82D
MDYRNVDWEWVERYVRGLEGQVICKEKWNYKMCFKLQRVDSWYVVCPMGEVLSNCYLLIHSGCTRVWYYFNEKREVVDWGFQTYCDRGDPP